MRQSTSLVFFKYIMLNYVKHSLNDIDFYGVTLVGIQIVRFDKIIGILYFPCKVIKKFKRLGLNLQKKNVQIKTRIE